MRCMLPSDCQKSDGVLKASQALRLPFENRRHVRRFSCFFARKSFLSRTNGRENGSPFDQGVSALLEKVAAATFSTRCGEDEQSSLA